MATYVAYCYVAASDEQWARSARQEWNAEVERYTPRQLTLDWGFMRTLPPDELAQTYAWYQYTLNLRAAAVHPQQGTGFLQKMKTTLPLHDLSNWSSESLLEGLEQIAPGFRAWAVRFNQRPN